MQEDIYKAIYAAIDVINQQMQSDDKLKKSPETVLFGSESQLDSMDLINLIVGVEEKLREHLGENIALADDRALSQEVSPFTSVSTLSSYITLLLDEKRQRQING